MHDTMPHEIYLGSNIRFRVHYCKVLLRMLPEPALSKNMPHLQPFPGDGQLEFSTMDIIEPLQIAQSDNQ